MSGRIVKVSGPLVVAEGMEDANMADDGLPQQSVRSSVIARTQASQGCVVAELSR